jgi:hypothetical protein
MRTIKTYSKRAPFYNAFSGTDPHNLSNQRGDRAPMQTSREVWAEFSNLLRRRQRLGPTTEREFQFVAAFRTQLICHWAKRFGSIVADPLHPHHQEGYIVALRLTVRECGDLVQDRIDDLSQILFDRAFDLPQLLNMPFWNFSTVHSSLRKKDSRASQVVGGTAALSCRTGPPKSKSEIL